MPNTIAALVLMGGQNKRMKGQHKAFLKCHHLSFLDTILSHLQIFPKIYLSIDEPSKFKALPYPTITDIYSHIGPLGGIVSTLKEIPEDFLFVTACDMPFISEVYVHYMYQQFENLSPTIQCIVLQDEHGFLYPLGAIYSKELLPLMEVMIKNKDYRLRSLISQSQSLIIPFSTTPFSSSVLTNINTPEDYNQYFSTC